MNFAIILSFLILIISVLILMFPKQLILKLGYYKRYDMETVPRKYLVAVIVLTTLIMITALAVLMVQGSLLESTPLIELFTYE